MLINFWKPGQGFLSEHCHLATGAAGNAGHWNSWVARSWCGWHLDACKREWTRMEKRANIMQKPEFARTLRVPINKYETDGAPQVRDICSIFLDWWILLIAHEWNQCFLGLLGLKLHGVSSRLVGNVTSPRNTVSVWWFSAFPSDSRW